MSKQKDYYKCCMYVRIYSYVFISLLVNFYGKDMYV